MVTYEFFTVWPRLSHPIDQLVLEFGDPGYQYSHVLHEYLEIRQFNFRDPRFQVDHPQCVVPDRELFRRYLTDEPDLDEVLRYNVLIGAWSPNKEKDLPILEDSY